MNSSWSCGVQVKRWGVCKQSKNTGTRRDSEKLKSKKKVWKTDQEHEFRVQSNSKTTNLSHMGCLFLLQGDVGKTFWSQNVFFDTACKRRPVYSNERFPSPNKETLKRCYHRCFTEHENKIPYKAKTKKNKENSCKGTLDCLSFCVTGIHGKIYWTRQSFDRAPNSTQFWIADSPDKDKCLSCRLHRSRYTFFNS